MPYIVCKCGDKIRYDLIPCSAEWKIISSEKYDKYTGMIDAEVLFLDMKSFFKCPNCGRLWVYWDRFDEEPTSYMPE